MVVSIFAATLLGSGSAFAQNRTISGTVVDTGGQPVIGAAVTVVGNTRIGAATDINGAFTLNVPAGANISVESIGYVSQTFAIGNQTTFNIVLEEDTEMLEETVVIGYGVQKKSDLTGAVASVRQDDLQNRSTTDAAAALQGKAAGIQIINSSGAPGSGADIRVRGYSSNSGNIGPLLIVDGLKVDNIQYLDPSMIESMEVLKDAASAAIYGAQAGNGVVLITTKSGQEGRASVTYNGRFTLQSLGKKADIFHAKEYIEYQTAIGNLSQDLLTKNGYNGQDTDWYDASFQPSWSQQHGITFQGGNRNGHFFTSLNYVDQDGIFVGKKDVYNRLTAQINADYQLFKWLSVSTNNSIEKWSRKSVSNGYGSVLNSVVSIDPLTPAYISRIEDTPGGMQEHYATNPELIPRDPTHNNDFYGTSKYLEEATGNPLFQRDRTDSTSDGFNIRGSLAANLTPITGLTFTSRLGYRIAQNSSHSYSKPYWLTSMAQSANHDISAGVNTSWYYQWENFVNFNRTFGKHSVGAMAGMSYTESHSDNASLSANGPDPLKGYEPNFLYMDYVLTNDSTSRSFGNAPSMSAQLSYYGRLMYSFDNRYSIQANFRADAYDSSKLSKQARWGYFPSVSVGWTISNEPFFKDNVNRNAVSFLKLRGSWGLNGNVNVLSGYRYSTSITLNGQYYQYNPGDGAAAATYGSMPSGLANPNLKWETSEQYDAGLDARFLNNRLTLTVDWYRKLTNDLLIQVNNLPEIGVANSWVNAGKVLNQGLEFELGWKDTIGDFSYSINANLSTLENKVLEVHSLVDRINTDVVSGLNELLVTSFEAGYPIWYFRGYEYAGVDQATGAAQYYDMDGKITTTPGPNDLKYLGEGIPNLTYGLTVNLAWKGLDLVIFGTGAAGNEIYNLMVSADRPKTNGLTYFWRNSWKQPGDNAKFPESKQVASSWPFFSSSAAVFNGAFFKIKQLQLGYTLPKAITQKALISDLRFFVSLDDFFTFTSYPGADPETASLNSTSSRGVDSGSYPTTKKVVFGVNLTF
ncbi:MAG: TonB-dependent receptor [Bacteroidales bacterium]|nr:TonB-dependent receptor [Bacteroidales bacterium]